jgi:origin recognition complex subunit 3
VTYGSCNLASLISYSSWLDRIPFTLLFGIATSVELFQDRLPRKVTSLLYGAQFDVEQTSKTSHKVFQSVIAGYNLPLRLGPGFVTALLERQRDHVQSLEVMISTLKVRGS